MRKAIYVISYTRACIDERYTEGFTELFSLFIENALGVMGYNLMEKETSEGIIRLKLRKK